LKAGHAKPFVKARVDLKVLVVDDDPFEVEVIAALLAKLGVRDITKAVGGDAATHLLKQRPASFDLLLTDLHMPGMDGFEFMALAAKSGFKGALIIVSGQTEEVMHGASLVAKLSEFNLIGTLKKPVTKAALSLLIPL
jgi:CheY-like chemotaxis protein